MQVLADKRIDILMQALGERYNAQHKIRERTQSVGVWSIGLSAATSGWFLQSGVQLSLMGRIYLIIGTVVAYGALRYAFLADLEKGFNTQQRVAARIEEELGLYTVDPLGSGQTPIYPQTWRSAGQDGSPGGFFASTYLLIYISAALLAVSVLFSTALSQSPS